MTTTEQLEAVRNQIGDISHNVRCAYVNTMVLRHLYEEKESLFNFSLCEHPAPQVLNIQNSAAHMAGFVTTGMLQEFTATKTALDLAEASDAWKEANGIIGPLVDEIRKLEAQIERENAEHGARLRALAEAEEAATAAALAKVDRDPKVIAARQALEAASA